MQSMGIEKVVISKHYIKLFWFSIFGLMLYFLYASAHVYNYYAYNAYSIEYEGFVLKVKLKERYSETYDSGRRRITDISSVYGVGATVSYDQQKIVDSVVFKRILIKNLSSNQIYNVSIPHEVEIKKEIYDRVHYGFGTVNIPKESYYDHDVLIEFNVVFDDGTEKNYKAKGVIKTDFKWRFSWDTFDMIMSI